MTIELTQILQVLIQMLPLGFVGDFYGGSAKNCYSESPVNLDVLEISDSEITIGGFSGRIYSPIDYCYALSDLNITGSRYIDAGGFSGSSVSNNTQYISNCYALGNVNVVRLGNESGTVAVGGFISILNMNARNCYALGNVFVYSNDRRIINAGGFVGSVSQNVERCFAAGTVTVHRDNEIGETNAGGLVGNRSNNRSITNSVTIGASVTATGGAERNVGRVFGVIGTGTFTGNRSFNSMRLYSDSRYDPRDPAQIPFDDIDSDDEGQHGEDATEGNFRTASWWTGLGFTTANGWNANDATGRRYPTLLGLGGQ